MIMVFVVYQAGKATKYRLDGGKITWTDASKSKEYVGLTFKEVMQKHKNMGVYQLYITYVWYSYEDIKRRRRA